ncbi:hypothetical protein [Bradyrhizobium sp. sGM-13]|uniref:hypothetical protein n=1 Tax=Bradyrhizobium sp. sGM-13 TaxID=2831781 RepID=UPI001BCBBCAE|nr:hypothetical protein [Bradyrhizobium sp. sGM-13]
MLLRSALGEVRRGDRQETRWNRQRDEGIVTESFEGKGSYERHADDDDTDGSQQMKRSNMLGGARQSTGLVRNFPSHQFTGLSGARP